VRLALTSLKSLHRPAVLLRAAQIELQLLGCWTEVAREVVGDLV